MPALSPRVIRRHFRQADAATTNEEKGRALEDLACYLFGKVPGLSLSWRRQKNSFATEEIDVAFWNEQYPTGLRSFNAIILVECKNWSKPVGSSEVSWFASKIESRALDFGILIAANGITGSADDSKEAHRVVSTALAKGIRLIVITRKEIESLRTTDELVRMIKLKLCQLVASGTVWP